MNPNARARLFRVTRVATLSFLLMLLVACGEAISGIELPDVSAPEVTAPEVTTPEVTTPPPTTPDAGAPDEGAGTEEGDIPAWAWVLIILVIVGLVAWIGARSGSRGSSTQPAAAPAWKPAAQTGYADARWLYDQLTPSLALWKGDSEYESQTGTPSPASDKSATWSEASTRLKSARDALYRVESQQAQTAVGSAANDLVASLNSVREGVDRLAAAQTAARGGGPEAEVAAATEELSSRRASLQGAISRLGGQL